MALALGKKRTDHGETPEGKLKDHLAHVDSYTQRELAKITALAKAGHLTIEAVGDAMIELIKAANSNPIIGVAVAVIVADILATTKVITPLARNMIFGFCSVGFGVSVTAELLSAAESVLPWDSSAAAGAGNSELVRPTATTIAYGSEGAPPTAQPVIPAGALMSAVEAVA